MKVLIIDIDSKIVNFALKKIEKYHLQHNDDVIWNNELFKYSADKIYVSCIFCWNKEKCKDYENIHKAEIGGSGYDLDKKLPDEIEKIQPHINLGFSTRGCIRKCPFCVVPKKEGMIRAVADIYDIWDQKNRDITLLDNNLLSLPEQFFKVASQLKKENLKIDFNQGLDIRLVTKEIAEKLSTLKTSNKFFRFAFDDIRTEDSIRKGIETCLKYGVSEHKMMFYLLVGFNSSIEDDIKRAEIIRNYNLDVYFMFYNNFKVPNNDEINKLASKIKDKICKRFFKPHRKIGFAKGNLEKFIRYCAYKSEGEEYDNKTNMERNQNAACGSLV